MTPKSSGLNLLNDDASLMSHLRTSLVNYPQTNRMARTGPPVHEKHINVCISRLNEQHKELKLIRVVDCYMFLRSCWEMSVLCSCFCRQGMLARTHKRRDTNRHTSVDWHPKGPCNPLGCNLCLCAVRLVQILNFLLFQTEGTQLLRRPVCNASAIAILAPHPEAGWVQGQRSNEAAREHKMLEESWKEATRNHFNPWPAFH